MTLTPVEMEALLSKASPREVGDVWFDCPNCEKEHHEKIWEEASEVDEDGEIFYDFPHALKNCDCGASILVAWHPDGEGELYWLNKKDMQACSDTLTEGEK